MTIPLGRRRLVFDFAFVAAPTPVAPSAPRATLPALDSPLALDATDAELARLGGTASAHERRREAWTELAYQVGFRPF